MSSLFLQSEGTFQIICHNQFCMKQYKFESLLKIIFLLNKFSVPERGRTLSVRGEKGRSWTQDAGICQEMDEVCDDKM